MGKNFNRPLSWLAPASYVLLVGVGIYLAFSHWAYDDPFITYRYAENLRRGIGFVYNPDQRILSTTTPLFTLLLAGASVFWSDIPRLAVLVGAFSLGMGGLALWVMGRNQGNRIAAWAGLLLYPTFPLLLSTLGSETPLYIALCLGAMVFYLQKRLGWAAVFSALAALTRPDGLLVAILLGADFVWKQFRRPAPMGASLTPEKNAPEAPSKGRWLARVPWKEALLFTGLFLAWIIFAWFYFGSPVPVTLAAKQHQGGMAISQRFAAGFVDVAADYARNPLFLFEALLAGVGLVWALARAQRAWMLLWAWTALYFVSYTLLGVSSYYWYYAPLVPGFVAATGCGMEAISRAGQKISRQDRLVIFRGLAIATLVLLALLQGVRILRVRQNYDRRAAAYQAVGKWLALNTPPEASIGALEVGIIGYYAHRPMVDFAGLLQPQVGAQLNQQSTYADSAAWAVEKYRPQFVVLHAGLFPVLEQRLAGQHCRVVKQFPGAAYGYRQDLTIYQCQ
jgi:hypothetical protein